MLKILDLRNDEIVHQSGSTLSALAKEAALENKAMVSLAHQSLSDSLKMKVATVIAMFYLPASLVTVR